MDLFEKAHVLVSTNAECAQGHRRLAKHRLFQELHGLGRHWRDSLALGHPTKALVQQLDLVGIPSVYMVRRAEGTPPSGDAQLSFSYLNSRTSQICQPRVFRAGEIVPRTEAPFRRHTMVVFPFEQGDGYCAVEMGPEEPQIYNATQIKHEVIHPAASDSDSRINYIIWKNLKKLFAAFGINCNYYAGGNKRITVNRRRMTTGEFEFCQTTQNVRMALAKLEFDTGERNHDAINYYLNKLNSN